MNKKTLKIDIVSDVACPWCYIGKRRLENAIAEWEGDPIEIEWHPFQLDPNVPAAGLDRDTYLMNKFGDLEASLAMTERLTTVGKEEGITFNFGKEWKAINTLPLHQLLHEAGKEGFKDALKERFLKAYFDENLPLNEIGVLCSLLLPFGWPAEKTKKVLEDDAIAYAVKQEIAHYQQRGVNSVPFFIINNTYGISGAQSPATFLKAFEQVSTASLSDKERCDAESGIC
ncbi:MAG: DsbA family oxidoreductase [Maribacter sp.]